ncbi:MAG: 4Fe-4S binding protein [Brevinematales bacterium]|nr:4Fe-4S binding protein [Brevinematales bacterium]
MKTVIYYFTGTGNSLWAARKIGGYLGDTELIPIIRAMKEKKFAPEASRIGFVFPLYFGGIPLIVADFIRELDFSGAEYIFTVCTRGFHIAGGAIKQMKNLLLSQGSSLSLGLYLNMIDNYLPTFDIPAKEALIKTNVSAQDKTEKIARMIAAGKKKISYALLEINGNILYPSFLRGARGMDAEFILRDTCNGCATCEMVCPVNNIRMTDSRPEFLHHCEQCYACAHACPKLSIVPGTKSLNKKRRFRNPEIALRDIIAQKSG